MESTRTKWFRRFMNLWPCIRGTGGRIQYIAHDWLEMRVKLVFSWRTRNYVNTIFGGSMYGACDPEFMIMFIKALGPEYVVWDKSATIHFKKPGREHLYAIFKIAPEELADIRKTLESQPKLERTYSVDLVNKEGVVHATVEKLMYIRRKNKNPHPSA